MTNISWFTSIITDVGVDYRVIQWQNSTGTIDYFHRKRNGLPQTKYDVLPPVEMGYALPPKTFAAMLQKGGEILTGLYWSIR